MSLNIKSIIYLSFLFYFSCMSLIVDEDFRIIVKNGNKIEFQDKEFRLRKFNKDFEEFIKIQKSVKDKIYIEFVVENDVEVLFMKKVKEAIRNHFKFINLVVYSPKGKESIVRLPPNSNVKVDPTKLKKRNLLILYLSEDGKIYHDSISDSTRINKNINLLAYDFLRNENNNPDLPELRSREIEGIGEVRCASKSIIALHSSNEAKYIDYSRVYYQLKEAYEKIWNEDSEEYFNISFDELTSKQQEKIKTITPYVLSEI